MKNYICLICIFFLIRLNPGVGLHRVKIEIKGSLKSYSGLTFMGVMTLPSSFGVKSVLFNTARTKLYALNLEGMSIYEFDQANKKITREFQFEPTNALGWDYGMNKSIPSFAEKPVEGRFTQDDKILWVSLHNAGGIVPIMLDTLSMHNDSFSSHVVMYHMNIGTQDKDTVELPLIKTGIMPKVIEKTADERHLLVSNWGSKTVSVLKLSDTLAPYVRKIATVPMPAIPRGMAIDDQKQCAYVAIMGGNSIKVISTRNWKIIKSIKVSENPRHIVLDTAGRLFVSFNVISQIACIEPKTGKILFKAHTNFLPRTIALSNNQKFLFVTCYGGNTIDVFKVNKQSFTKLYALKCEGKPVGIALYEDQDKLEAWVCNYLAGNLKVYTFKKS